jgi:C1A family cysteine protease
MKNTKSMHLLINSGVVLAVIAIGISAQAAEDSIVNAAKVQQINQIIQAKGAQWKAKETWVSKLSPNDLRRMLGSNDMPTTNVDFTNSKSTRATSVDWRNQNGINWLSPIMNQGNCGSCVAFATVATLEAQMSISSGLPWMHPTFSPEQLFACGGGGCDSGWMPNSAASFIKSKGIVDQACAPYTMGSTGKDVSCSQATNGCSDMASRTYKISDVARPTDGIFKRSVDNVKAALAKGPLVTTLTVYTDFLTYSGGIYKHVSGKAEGGHAVSIVGYDDATRVWIVRNSWGPEWGENGFVRVSWDDKSGVASSTWQFQVPTKNEYLTISGPAENDYVSGNYQIKVGNNTSDNLNVDVRQAGTQKSIAMLTCARTNKSECISVLDTTQLADGRYEAIAKSGSSNSFSQTRSFYVVNHTPENLSLSVESTDLSKPLAGRPEFDIDAQSGSVPFHHVTFFLRQNGKIVAQRTIDVVLPKMKFGFRTNTVPNGNYELFFRGEIPAAGKIYSAESKIANVSIKN